MRRLVLSTLVMLAASACLATTDRQDEARKMADQLYASLQQQDWQTALSLYGKRFYGHGMTRELWRHRLERLQKRLGPIQNRTLIFSEHDPRFRYDAYIFIYRIHHARGESRETITIYKAVDGDRLHIVGHKITIEGGP